MTRRALDLVAYTAGPAYLLCALALPACASLDNLTRRAAQAQREAAALVMALDSYLEACEAQQEPKPRGCTEAERLRVQLEPYVQVVQP